MMTILNKTNDLIVPYELINALSGGFSGALSKNSKLNTIFFGNELDDIAALKLITLLTNNKKIKMVAFIGNSITENTQQKIESFLDKNKDRKILFTVDEIQAEIQAEI